MPASTIGEKIGYYSDLTGENGVANDLTARLTFITGNSTDGDIYVERAIITGISKIGRAHV